MIFRRETGINVILGFLLRNPKSSGAEISRFGFIGSAAMYPLLMSLEREGWIRSWWEPGSYPRRKLYQVAKFFPEAKDGT